MKFISLEYVKKIPIPIISILLVITSILTRNTTFLCIAILMILLLAFYKTIHDIHKNIVFILFNCMLTLFVSGKVIVDGLYGEAFQNFSRDIQIHSLLCIYLSHFFLYLGYMYFINKKSKSKEEGNSRFDYSNYTIVYKILLFFYIISTISFSFVILEKILFVSNNGYLDFYTSFSSKLPLIVLRVSNLFYIVFFAIINFPMKKRIEYTIYVSFLSLSILTVFTGQRSHVALNIMILLIILFLKNKDILLKLYNKKIAFTMVIVFVLSLIGLQGVQSYRNDHKINFSDLNPFKLLYTQGYTSNVIAYSKLVENSLDDNLYSIASVRELIKNNSILKKLFNFKSYKGNTYDIVQYDSYLSYDVSYLILGDQYYKGEGLGTCYIAEIYHDFSYVGVCIFAIICSYLCIAFNNYYKKNFVLACIMLISLKYFLFLPRWDTLYFLAAPFQSMNIIIIILLYFFNDYKIESLFKIFTKKKE